MSQEFKGKKVLFVEDDEANQYFMQLMLEESGCNYAAASNGQEAVEKVRADKYDIIFMDLKMPVMDGFEATRVIREGIDKTVLIVAVSANVLTDAVNKCFSVGMNGFIAKGSETEKFEEEILSWLAKS
jgi:CheY-like chemotaxis protein